MPGSGASRSPGQQGPSGGVSETEACRSCAATFRGCRLLVVPACVDSGVIVKKGRHRRFEEARNLKRAIEIVAEPCPECGAKPGEEHASWCMAMEDEEPDEEPEAE